VRSDWALGTVLSPHPYIINIGILIGFTALIGDFASRVCESQSRFRSAAGPAGPEMLKTEPLSQVFGMFGPFS
jgi:hypothetical protein